MLTIFTSVNNSPTISKNEERRLIKVEMTKTRLSRKQVPWEKIHLRQKQSILGYDCKCSNELPKWFKLKHQSQSIPQNKIEQIFFWIHLYIGQTRKNCLWKQIWKILKVNLPQIIFKRNKHGASRFLNRLMKNICTVCYSHFHHGKNCYK